MSATMTGSGADDDRDAVLCAFMESCPSPTPAQIEECRTRYPRLADDLMDVASDLLLDRLAPEPRRPEPDAKELEAWRAGAEALAHAIAMPRRSPLTLGDLIDAAGTDLPALCETMDVDRDVLAEIEAGHVMLPIGETLVARLAAELHQTVEVVEDGLASSLWQPQLGHAKSSGTPAIRRVSFRQAVLESDMSEERKAFWLGDPR